MYLQAINDKDIVERRWAATDSKDREDADAVVLACLLNLALLYQKMQRWADAARAAEAAIEHHPGCAKAYFRKAQVIAAYHIRHVA